MNDYFEEEEFESQINKDTIWRIGKLGLRHWPMMGGFLLFISLVSVVEAFHTYLNKQMIDLGIIAGDMAALKHYALIYLATWPVFVILVMGFILCAGWLGHRVQYDLRQSMFDHLQELPLSYYDKTPTGWLMSRATSDVTRVGDLVSWGFLDMTWTVTSVSASLFFMFLINWKMTLIVIAIIPLLYLVAVNFKKYILIEYRMVRKVNSKITGAFSENISGVRVVKSLRREERNINEFQNLTNEMYSASFKAAWLSALFLPAVQLVSASAIAIIVWYSGVQYEGGMMTIGSIHAFVSYITFMLWPVQQLAAVYASMQQAIASGERIFSLLDTEVDIVDAPDAIDPGTIRGDIVFDHVTFSYVEENAVLTNFNLTIPQGETVALVGPTGAGKSTIVNLLCRFYEPTGGAIRFNGRDYRSMTQASIQSRVGMVLQTPHLFSGTAMENLKYGRLSATDEEVIAAAKMAGADGFIRKLEKGYQTEVGEGGVLLSTGQKQLISLARAIMVNPDLFIMDEATSAVDTLTESLIQKGMDVLMKGRTSFIIAHRLSTIKNADRILVIEDGGISEMGSHAELIKQRGHYYNLYTRQFREQAARV